MRRKVYFTREIALGKGRFKERVNRRHGIHTIWLLLTWASTPGHMS